MEHSKLFGSSFLSKEKISPFSDEEEDSKWSQWALSSACLAFELLALARAYLEDPGLSFILVFAVLCFFSELLFTISSIRGWLKPQENEQWAHKTRIFYFLTVELLLMLLLLYEESQNPEIWALPAIGHILLDSYMGFFGKKAAILMACHGFIMEILISLYLQIEFTPQEETKWESKNTCGHFYPHFVNFFAFFCCYLIKNESHKVRIGEKEEAQRATLKEKLQVEDSLSFVVIICQREPGLRIIWKNRKAEEFLFLKSASGDSLNDPRSLSFMQVFPKESQNDLHEIFNCFLKEETRFQQKTKSAIVPIKTEKKQPKTSVPSSLAQVFTIKDTQDTGDPILSTETPQISQKNHRQEEDNWYEIKVSNIFWNNTPSLMVCLKKVPEVLCVLKKSADFSSKKTKKNGQLTDMFTQDSPKSQLISKSGPLLSSLSSFRLSCLTNNEILQLLTEKKPGMEMRIVNIRDFLLGIIVSSFQPYETRRDVIRFKAYFKNEVNSKAMVNGQLIEVLMGLLIKTLIVEGNAKNFKTHTEFGQDSKQIAGNKVLLVKILTERSEFLSLDLFKTQEITKEALASLMQEENGPLTAQKLLIRPILDRLNGKLAVRFSKKMSKMLLELKLPVRVPCIPFAQAGNLLETGFFLQELSETGNLDKNTKVLLKVDASPIPLIPSLSNDFNQTSFFRSLLETHNPFIINLSNPASQTSLKFKKVDESTHVFQYQSPSETQSKKKKIYSTTYSDLIIEKLGIVSGSVNPDYPSPMGFHSNTALSLDVVLEVEEAFPKGDLMCSGNKKTDSNMFKTRASGHGTNLEESGSNQTLAPSVYSPVNLNPESNRSILEESAQSPTSENKDHFPDLDYLKSCKRIFRMTDDKEQKNRKLERIDLSIKKNFSKSDDYNELMKASEFFKRLIDDYTTEIFEDLVNMERKETKKKAAMTRTLIMGMDHKSQRQLVLE